MRGDARDTVTPGGDPAPLGARGGASDVALEGRARSAGRYGLRPQDVGGPTWALVVLLVATLGGFAGLAHGVVDGGRLVELDLDVATWVAREMPAWAEWVARPFTWLGGYVGMKAVLGVTAIVLARRGASSLVVLAVVVAVGTHLLVLAAKDGYGRQRPQVGSAIELPSSMSFPSGHAANGLAVFGLLGLLVASGAGSAARRRAAVAAGLVLGALVGVSRVILDVHYVSDVLAGACLGLAWLSACLLVPRLFVS